MTGKPKYSEHVVDNLYTHAYCPFKLNKNSISVERGD